METGLFHVLNRGVEKRSIFMDDQDRARFVHDLYEFNDTRPAPQYSRREEMLDLRNPTSRELLVDIHGWCLMDNHYHLLLSEKIEGGLTKFIRKLNVGYANYFNERYERSGSLYQGRTKKILIQNDTHFLHILHYIHLNPLDYVDGAEDWRSGTILSMSDALAQLHSYRWSSYQDYCGNKNFASILSKELFTGVFGNIQKATEHFLKDLDIGLDTSITLE